MSAAPATLWTIGYEGTTVPAFLATLKDAGIELLVDVRAVASSRRPGFAKTALTANVATIGVGYVHLRGLGTPADGRAAARKGRHEEMHRIFGVHMQTLAAQEDLEELLELIGSGKRVCILCFEAEPAECHRALVAKAVNARRPVIVVDLMPQRAQKD